ncbi:cellulose biosynthesis protein BcsN [Rhizobium sp. YIM 134829]|uniref:cellulose biosynthesis protein BcsN n=1 Tax=Rhizobium sp. YIM 134829 TaxID=3390453 RepID=UPI00397945CF
MSGAPTEVPLEQAMAFPPPGGPGIVSVVERKYSNAIEQEILLETATVTPGENYLKVQFYGPSEPGLAGADRLSRAGFNTGKIARDLRSMFPSMPMAITATYQQNGYGPFGYAYGVDTQRGESCLYAWQEISSSDHARNGIKDLGMIRTRLRLCEPDSSLAALLSVMYHYTLNGGFDAQNWNPYGPPPEPDARIGAAGKPIYSLPGEELVVTPRAVPTAAPRPRVRATAARVEVEAPAPAVTRRPAVEALVPRSPAATPTVLIPTPSLPRPADAAAEARTVGIPSDRTGPAPSKAPTSAPVIPAPPSIPSAPCTAKEACTGF